MLAAILSGTVSRGAGAPPVQAERDRFARRVETLCRNYVSGFGSEATQLVYHHRLNGPRGLDTLTSPAEIEAGTVSGRPLPYGYGSGIQDVALEGGQFLFALCEAHEATGSRWTAELARWIFQGLKRVASVSPEPGFVPRGPHPNGTSYYEDSSRDQHAALAEALWRYGRSTLATAEDRRFIAAELDEMARRFEKNDWKILVEDGSQIAHVGFGWRQWTSIGAVSLISFLAMTAEATGDPHWQDVLDHYSNERDGLRWNELLHPDAVGRWKPFTLYSNQFAQAFLALKRTTPDRQRHEQIGQLLRDLANRAIHTNALDPTFWRRLDWAGAVTAEEAEARLNLLGLSSARPATVIELFESFDSAWWQSDDSRLRGVGGKLCFGIPTAAFHKALLAEDAALAAEVAPHVRRMVDLMHDYGPHYQTGENFNRSAVLGLLLVAAESRHAETNGSSSNNGSNGSTAIDPRPLGAELPCLGELGVGPCIDAHLAGQTLYAIGAGKLHVADVADPKLPRLLASLGGLGHVRQMAVASGVAYVTAREDGLFVVDVADPTQPKRIAHYDTIELATGIAVSGDVAFVACRTAGVELVDISDPANPRHLSTVRTGEAQSVDVRNGVLFAGVWGSRELVVCDVSNPHTPSVLARAPLDGYGDGVDVCGNYCYAATGHHSRETPRAKEGDPGFGRGHGLEIFDIADPAHPRRVGHVKFPPLYRLGMDMWDVTVSGTHAFVADTYNGVFVVDVARPSEPRMVAHHQLPLVPKRGDPSPVGGLAVGEAVVYVAGVWSDLHVLAAPSARPVVKEPDRAPRIPPPPEAKPDPRFQVFRPKGQVHAVAIDGDLAWVAAGMDGLHAVELSPDLRGRAAYPTRGFALDVAASGQHVYVAEGMGGLSIWKHLGDGRLESIGRYRAGNESIRQVVVAPSGARALLHVGPSTLHVVDLRNPAEPVRKLRDSRLGLFYYSPLARGFLDNRYACCHWHVSGLYWYDVSGEIPRFSGDHYPFRIGSTNGVAMLDDRALVTCRGGFALFGRDESRPPDELPIARVPGAAVSGKPTVDGTVLYVSDRYRGQVAAIDFSDLAKPKRVGQLALRGHPGLVTVSHGVPLIPAGYQGLLRWDQMGHFHEVSAEASAADQPGGSKFSGR